MSHGPRLAVPPLGKQENTINWQRLGKLALVGIATFAAIIIADLVLIQLMVPTISLARMVAFTAMMFAAGAVVAAVIWAAKGKA